jgi:hypothetical protein
MYQTPVQQLMRDPRVSFMVRSAFGSNHIQNYMSEPGVTYTGQMLQGEFDSSPEECARICDSRPNCNGFTYNNEWGTCALGQTRVEKIKVPGNTYYRRTGSLDKNPLLHPDLGYWHHSPHGFSFN